MGGYVPKYAPLFEHLSAWPRAQKEYQLSFAEIDQLVSGSLPGRAREREAWWTKPDRRSSAARAWQDAGWRVSSVDLVTQKVVFTRDDHARQRSLWRIMAGDLVAAVIAATAAGLSGILGLAHLPWWALLALGAMVAGVAWTVTQAVQTHQEPALARMWWIISTSIALVLPVGALVYHVYFDPANHPQRTYQFVVNGNQDRVIDLYGEAGGPAQTLATGSAGQQGLIGGQSYGFDCWTIGPGGNEWLRYERFGQRWWAPRSMLHPPYGESEPSLPHC